MLFIVCNNCLIKQDENVFGSLFSKCYQPNRMTIKELKQRRKCIHILLSYFSVSIFSVSSSGSLGFTTISKILLSTFVFNRSILSSEWRDNMAVLTSGACRRKLGESFKQ